MRNWHLHSFGAHPHTNERKKNKLLGKPCRHHLNQGKVNIINDGINQDWYHFLECNEKKPASLL